MTPYLFILALKIKAVMEADLKYFMDQLVCESPKSSAKYEAEVEGQKSFES